MQSNVAVIEKVVHFDFYGALFQVANHLKKRPQFKQKYWMPQFMVYICCIKICLKQPKKCYSIPILDNCSNS